MNYYQQKHAEKQKLPMDFPSSLSWHAFGFVRMTVIETAMEQHQPVDTGQARSLFP